jgi:hypothetical protein
MRANLSASMAEPSSKSSSTIPTEESFLASLLAGSMDLFPRMKDLNLFNFLGGDCGGFIDRSGGIMSTTMHVVSSFSPLVLNASYHIMLNISTFFPTTRSITPHMQASPKILLTCHIVPQIFRIVFVLTVYHISEQT